VVEQGSGHQQGREPVGTVAEETARLMEALGGWADGLKGQQHHDARGPEPETREEPEPETRGDPAGTRHTGRCEHCGVSSRAGEALTCQLCPLCQGIALLRTVRPETVERLADVAAALSGALRDIAADRFGQHPQPPQPPPPRGHHVQDIAVDDEDEPGGAPRPDQARRTQEKTAP
jgi:hypothetical protein